MGELVLDFNEVRDLKGKQLTSLRESLNCMITFTLVKLISEDLSFRWEDFMKTEIICWLANAVDHIFSMVQTEPNYPFVQEVDLAYFLVFTEEELAAVKLLWL